MTASDNLATALQAARGVFEMYGANLTPVNMLEAEIARLTELNSGLTRDFNAMLVEESKQRNRAEAAEAVSARLRRLVDEARPYMEKANSNAGPINDWLSRALDGDEDGGDGREPDGYRTEGGRVIPTDR